MSTPNGRDLIYPLRAESAGISSARESFADTFTDSRRRLTSRPEHVAICIATCRRPQLLAWCLHSLVAMQRPDGVYMRVIVVGNGEGEAPISKAVVEGVKCIAPWPISYQHEAVQSIAKARNIAMGMARDQGADWICFIDDDEIADPNWLSELMAREWLGHDVLMGRNISIFPHPMPFWAIEKGAPSDEEGYALKTACCGNVRFSMKLVMAGLRFDEKLALTGGEDNDFFARAHVAGFRIGRTRAAVTRETVHPARCTYRAQVYRAYWCAASDMRRYAVAKMSWRKAIAGKAMTVPANLLAGAFWLALAPIGALGGPTRFKKYALRGGKRLAKSAGRLAAMLGHQPQPYRTIHGS